MRILQGLKIVGAGAGIFEVGNQQAIVQGKLSLSHWRPRGGQATARDRNTFGKLAANDTMYTRSAKPTPQRRKDSRAAPFRRDRYMHL